MPAIYRQMMTSIQYCHKENAIAINNAAPSAILNFFSKLHIESPFCSSIHPRQAHLFCFRIRPVEHFFKALCIDDGSVKPAILAAEFRLLIYP